LRAEGFFCSLDVLRGGLGINKLHFFISKYDFFQLYVKLANLGHQIHGSGLGTGPQSESTTLEITEDKIFLKLKITGAVIVR
jgi:hypothetical protein